MNNKCVTPHILSFCIYNLDINVNLIIGQGLERSRRRTNADYVRAIVIVGDHLQISFDQSWNGICSVESKFDQEFSYLVLLIMKADLLIILWVFHNCNIIYRNSSLLFWDCLTLRDDSLKKLVRSRVQYRQFFFEMRSQKATSQSIYVIRLHTDN